MGFTQLIAVLKARRGALLAVWGGVVLLALLLSLLLPRQYLASAEVVVEPRGGAKGAWNKVLHALQRPWKAAAREK